jgi:hypothetical protein
MVRVLLDTNVVRGFMHEPSLLKKVASVRGEIKFSMIPYCFAELLDDLCHDRHLFFLWKQIRRSFAALIDSNWPLLPHGYVLSVLIGILESSKPMDVEEVRKQMVGHWNTFIGCARWNHLRRRTKGRVVRMILKKKGSSGRSG